MRLLGVRFNKFKTIKSDDLDIENDVTCLVGVNEAGKSNVLIGIEYLAPDKTLTEKEISRHDDDYLTEGASPSIEARFAPDSHELQDELDNIFGLKVTEIRIHKRGNVYSVDFPAIDYDKSSVKDEVLGEEAGQQENPEAPEASKTGLSDEQKSNIRNAVVERVVSRLPDFRYFDSVNFADYYLPLDGEVKISELVANPESHQPVINLLKLAGVQPGQLTTYGTSPEKIRRTTRLKTASKKVNEELVGAFWPIDRVKLSLAAEEDTLTIRVDDGKDFSPGERSRGLQWALAFNIYFLSAADGELVDTVLLLDEPGIFLHIDAQKKMLKSTFKSINKLSNQIVYTTHLPYLIDKEYPEKIRILEKDNQGSTSIGNKSWSQSEFGNIPEPVRTALGVDLTDIVFGDVNVIVEGPSDQIYIREYLDKVDSTLLDSITIVPAYGADKVPGVVGLALLTGKKAVGVIDNDKDIQELKDKLSSVGIAEDYIIDIASIAEDSAIKTIEDTVPKSHFADSIYAVYSKETQKRGRSLEANDVDFVIPRKDGAEEFFRTKLTSPKHMFLKMDVARQFSYQVTNATVNLKAAEWSLAKKIVKYISNWAKEQ